ncbi:uncharacterized protein LOC135501037 [Lineus longissimus]|uniref:uncharacterized protein LOC135501037 n=1 Tax=Lineus longissimus TaxID=88925 RepID=UPI002B4D0F91
MGNYMTNYMAYASNSSVMPTVEAATVDNEKKDKESEQDMGDKVMVAIDPSKNCEKAFDFYMTKLYRPGVQIVFAHTTEPPYYGGASVLEGFGGWYQSETKKEYEAMLAMKREQTNKLQHHYINKLKSYGIDVNNKDAYRCRCMEYGGNAGEALVQIADEEQPMMIVMGSRGLGVLRRTILGSVSHYVMENVDYPVLVHKAKTWLE